MKKIIVSAFILGSLVTVAEASSYGPTARCKDGTYSYAIHHQGACSYHKGVHVWYR